MTDFEEISVNILPSVLQCRSNLISHRRWFHAHPELRCKGANINGGVCALGNYT